MKRMHYAIAGMLLLAAGAGALLWWRADRAGSAALPTTQASQGEVLYWYDPMVPDQHFDKPGKSPFMDMALVPRYANSSFGDGAVVIDPAIVQNLGLRLTRVERGVLPRRFELAGNVQRDERAVVVLQARAAAFVEGVHAHAPGDVVRRGASLIDLHVPEWSAAQAEFVALLDGADAALIDAARAGLRARGLPPELIARAEAGRRVQSVHTVTAPISGALENFDVRPGMAVEAGATLARIAGLDVVWVEAALPETAGIVPDVGGHVEVTLSALPAERFDGEIVGLLPMADRDTRSLRLRVAVRNPEGRLRPGMFARVQLMDGASRPVLHVAAEAVIHGGRSARVILLDNGRYRPVNVRTGGDVDGRAVILDGLEEGQQVVASAQFLIDSEANLQGMLERLKPAAERP